MEVTQSVGAEAAVGLVSNLNSQRAWCLLLRVKN